ncbi:hypothetical protein TRICI_001620 [Trichomonascus ciferrii]|uniref:Thioesterase domain-containing protein n=1 Tax=Trichomonascus ciferrii TaxID=44093 RepID=A0A642V8W6_9ASCO|nr:hypothetical protein TRICI_001620 [Trichomonascus ciferrii]
MFTKIGVLRRGFLNIHGRFYSTTKQVRRPRRIQSLFYGGLALGVGYGIGWGATGNRKRPSEAQKIKDLDNVPEYRYLHGHPLVKKLREDPNFVETRYYDAIPDEHRENMLTSGLLAGQGYLTVEPLVFTNVNEKEMYYLYHVGNRLSGHEGIVHGGFLATLLDEGLSRCTFPSLPNKYGVTANLNINYKAPVPAESYLLLHAKVIDAKGRRVKAQGEIHTLKDVAADEQILVEGTVTMVEPRWAKYFLWLFK